MENEQSSASVRPYLLPGSILLAAIMVSGSLLYLAGGGNGGNSGTAAVRDQAAPPVDRAAALAVSSRDVILGEPVAPVTFVEYGDYQCPFCARFFRETEPLLREQYIKTGKVRMVYRNFAFLGPESLAAAEAAECAKDQGKFWTYHDALFDVELADEAKNPRGFENNGNLNRDLFMAIADDLDLDAAAFASCYDGKKYAALVEEDAAKARALGVNATPTSFIDGIEKAGALPFAEFQSAIESLLAEAQQ